MGRMYVDSTPATRGEVDAEVYDATLTVEALREQAEAAGFELTPVEVDPEESGEPGGNASAAEWAAYARTRGAEDADLVDDEGKPLKRDALREKYQTPAPTGD